MTGNEAGGGAAALPLHRIQFTDEALTWRDAIQRVGSPLVKDGVVVDAYLDAVVETAEKMGPYFDLGRGIAMPHARPEAGAQAVGLSYLRTRTPVLLLDDPAHPIDLFIMLAAPDDKTHLGVLRRLAGVLTDSAQVQRLKDAEDANHVLAIVGEDAQ